MVRATYVLRGNTLFALAAGLDDGVPVGSAAWLVWLDAPETSSFRFEHGADGFTARRERRPGGLYWYAYRKRARQLRKAYLGRASELDLDRLKTVATALGRRWDKSPADEPRLVRFPQSEAEARRDNLPAQSTSFVGREQALADLKDLLGGTRLLSLTGSGGVGKTRLALEVAASIADEYPDGVWLMDLAPLNDPDLLPHQVASMLRVREQAGRDVSATLADALRTKQLLLILDNCEHLVASCAALADGLLHACPKVQVLTTSREVFGIAGETIWRVPSLSVPDAHAAKTDELLLQSEAVRLFVERACAAARGFALTAHNASAVAQICSRLDGIPLALELAAARLRALSVEDIASRMDDRFRLLTVGSRTALARHRTLRALLDWSYELLGEQERIVLARLAVFAGSWTLAAAEAVCADELVVSEDVVHLLAQLVDKSLVVLEPGREGRYRFLETLRQYASERLGTGLEADRCSKRHAVFFLALAEATEPQARTRQGEVWRERLEQDHDNLRTALRWLIERGQMDHARRLGVALQPFWLAQGYFAEGRTRLGELLADDGAGVPVSTRAKLCMQAGDLAMTAGDYAAAEPLLQEGLVLSRGVAEPALVAQAVVILATLTWFRRDFATARALAEEGVAASRLAGNKQWEGYNLWVLAQATHDVGDDATASALAESGLAVSSEAGYPAGVALALTTLGQIRFRHGDLSTARSLLERSLQEHRAANFPLGWLWTLANLGWVLLDQGEFAGARAHFLEALTIGRDVLGGRVRLAIPLEGFAQVASATSDPERSLRLAGSASALRETYGSFPAPTERWQLERWLGQARTVLGERAATAAWAAGRVLDPEQAIAEALDCDPATVPPSLAPPDQLVLTPREREIAMLVGQGLGTRQIAERLVIAEGTARVHVERILSKLGLHSRAQLAGWVVRRARGEAPALV